MILVIVITGQVHGSTVYKILATKGTCMIQQTCVPYLPYLVDIIMIGVTRPDICWKDFVYGTNCGLVQTSLL